jgi:alpha-ketoglutarate-dependent taurine dioxygenase
MTLEVRTLLEGFAAEVRGVDLSGALSEDTSRGLRSTFSQYAVLVLPGQASARREDLQRFAAVFGTPSGCGDITNLDDEGNVLDPESLDARYTRGNFLWHMDMLVLEKPPLAAMLLARELPPSGGGQTQFADLTRAWRRLAPARQRTLSKLRAVHTMETIRVKMGISDPEELKSEYSPGEHPLVCVDPHSRSETLFFGAHTSHIVGLPTKESDALLSELLDIATKEDAVYTHTWQLNDLLLWSNRRAMHRVLPYEYRRERRRLWRAEILSDQPPSPRVPWWRILTGKMSRPQATGR